MKSRLTVMTEGSDTHLGILTIRKETKSPQTYSASMLSIGVWRSRRHDQVKTVGFLVVQHCVPLPSLLCSMNQDSLIRSARRFCQTARKSIIYLVLGAEKDLT